MEQAHEPQTPVVVETSPSASPAPVTHDFAWSFVPVPTPQESDAFLGALKASLMQAGVPAEVRSVYMKVRTGPVTRTTGPAGIIGFYEIERVGIWGPQHPPDPIARDQGLRELEFMVDVPQSGNTFAYFVSTASDGALRYAIQDTWNKLSPSHRFNSSGECDPNGPIHVPDFSYSFLPSPHPISSSSFVVVTQLHGFDSDYNPALDFRVTITDTAFVSATPRPCTPTGPVFQCQSTQDTWTNYDWAKQLIQRLLVVILSLLNETLALALAAYLAFGGTTPGGNVSPLPGGVGCAIAGSPGGQGSFPNLISQPVATLSYTYLSCSAGGGTPQNPGGLFAGGSVNWAL
jgi:hypothetical protein